MTRSNIVLLVIALVQAIVYLALARPFADTSSDTEAPQRAFIAFQPTEVRGIELGGEDGKEVFSFARDDATDSWRFVEKDGFPVRVDKLGGAATSTESSLLVKLAAIEVGAAIATDEASREVLGVGDEHFERRLILRDAKGAELARFFVARGTRTGTVHLRRKGEKEIYVSDGIAYWDLGMSTVDFTGRNGVKIPADEVTALRLRKDGQPTIELKRSFEGEGKDRKPGPWSLVSPESGPAEQSAANELLTRLCDLSIDDVHGKKAPEGLSSSPALVTFEFDRAEGTDSMIVESRRDDGDFEVTWESPADPTRSGFHCVVPSWSLGEAASIGLDELRPKAPKEAQTPAEGVEPEEQR